MRSELGSPTPERGGKAKGTFRIEADGLEALETSLARVQKMLEGLGSKVSWGSAP